VILLPVYRSNGEYFAVAILVAKLMGVGDGEAFKSLREGGCMVLLLLLLLGVWSAGGRLEERVSGGFVKAWYERLAAGKFSGLTLTWYELVGIHVFLL